MKKSLKRIVSSLLSISILSVSAAVFSSFGVDASAPTVTSTSKTQGYQTYISVSDDSNVYGADHDYTYSKFKTSLTVQSINNTNETVCDINLVHNNYVLGQHISTTELGEQSLVLYTGTDTKVYSADFGNIGSENRAFNFSTAGWNGFYANPVSLTSYS